MAVIVSLLQTLRSPECQFYTGFHNQIGRFLQRRDLSYSTAPFGSETSPNHCSQKRVTFANLNNSHRLLVNRSLGTNAIMPWGMNISQVPNIAPFLPTSNWWSPIQRSASITTKGNKKAPTVSISEDRALGFNVLPNPSNAPRNTIT